MIEKLHERYIKQRLYSAPGEPVIYEVVGSEPPNLRELTDKINEIIDYLNSNEREGKQ